MKCFEVRKGALCEGITLAKDGTVHVGEEGRGRKLVRVPVPGGAEVEERKLLSVASKDDGAVVLIRDHSGFRGGWSLKTALPDEGWDRYVQRQRLHWSGPSGSLTQGHALDGACSACDEQVGRLLCRPNLEVKVLAEGFCAQGDAGRMGGGPEYLLVLRPGQAIEIVRWGRLYGAPPTVRVACDADGNLSVSDPLADAEARAAAVAWEL